MAARLEGIFDGLAAPTGENLDKPIYSVMPLRGYESYFVGKDREGHACLLVVASEQGRLSSPIRLENLDVQFELRCHVKRGKEAERTGLFTVVRCRSLDAETARYFLSVCDTIIGMVGDRPRQREIASAVHRLAAIFQKLQKAPSRSVNGLFGELYVLSMSESTPAAVTAWRIDETARFDFADGNIRMDVKTTAGRVRAHTFSYEQCNPPPATVAIAASLFVERSPGGVTLRSVIAEIETSIAAYPDLVLKLHDVVTGTLGSDLTNSLALAFDSKLAKSSLRFYRLSEIPAIRGPLPAGVSDVHFRADLSALEAVSTDTLIESDAAFGRLLPRREL